MPEGFLFCLCKNKDFFSILSPFLKKVINEKATIPHPLRLIRGGLISSERCPSTLEPTHLASISQGRTCRLSLPTPCQLLAKSLPKGSEFFGLSPLRLIRGGLISSDIAPRPLNQRIRFLYSSFTPPLVLLSRPCSLVETQLLIATKKVILTKKPTKTYVMEHTPP